MQAVTTTLALAAMPATAEVVNCMMDDALPLTFEIDRSQFVAPIDRNDPPRQQRTNVQYGATTFTAAPFLLGDARGFEAIGPDNTSTIFVMQSDGSAALSTSGQSPRIAGTCTTEKDAK